MLQYSLNAQNVHNDGMAGAQKIMTLTETKQALGVSQNTIYAMIKDGRLNPLPVPQGKQRQRYRFREEEVMGLLQPAPEPLPKRDQPPAPSPADPPGE